MNVTLNVTGKVSWAGMIYFFSVKDGPGISVLKEIIKEALNLSSTSFYERCRFDTYGSFSLS